MSAQTHAPVPRLALRPTEAAAALGCSEDFFRTIQHELPWVRRGRVRLVSVRALGEWLDANSERVFEEAA